MRNDCDSFWIIIVSFSVRRFDSIELRSNLWSQTQINHQITVTSAPGPNPATNTWSIWQVVMWHESTLVSGTNTDFTNTRQLPLKRHQQNHQLFPDLFTSDSLSRWIRIYFTTTVGGFRLFLNFHKIIKKINNSHWSWMKRLLVLLQLYFYVNKMDLT